jgi:esterase/lipase
VPTLILQSHSDSVVRAEGAQAILGAIATPPELKRIHWFAHTDHQLFRDTEREAAIQAVVAFCAARLRAG